MIDRDNSSLISFIDQRFIRVVVIPENRTVRRFIRGLCMGVVTKRAMFIVSIGIVVVSQLAIFSSTFSSRMPPSIKAAIARRIDSLRHCS